MTQLFANNAASELASAVTSGAVSLTLKTGDGAKFPSPAGGDFFLVTLYQKVGQDEINHEIVKCTARAGDVLTIERAQEGTTARAFNTDDPVELRLTAGALDAKVGGDTVNNIGYLNIPQNSKSTAYTCVLADVGKHILHPAADTTARTFTIPANSSVPYPIGTALTFVNQNGTGGVVTIAITSDTMRLAGAGTTGSRTLARNGIATALKITATEWIISGTGLT